MLHITYISIGDELLRGRIVNTNARMLAHRLRPAGFDLQRIVTIGDAPEEIKQTVKMEMAQADVVIISGGLGPTKDDMTKHTLAAMFGMKLEWHQPTMDFLEERYARFNRTLNDTTRQQALMPDGCTVLKNNHGTAPGMLFEKDGKYVFSLPGVPFEMGHLITDQVLPKLQSSPSDNQYFIQKILRVTGIPESEAGERLETIHGLFPNNMKLAYLPRRDGLWLEFQATGPASSQEADTKLFEELYKKIGAAVSDKIYTEGDTDLALLLGEKLKAQNLSVASAESLTAGLLAARIVEVSGASAYYKGSIVAYETAQKTALLDVDTALIEEHGVASQAVAKAMALGVKSKLGADVGISTTGLAERNDETGTPPHAWIAVAHPGGVAARHVRLYGDRNETRARCAELAMILAFKHL